MSDPIYELVDLFKYKESVYSPLFMWLIILFSGIKLLQFKKSGWILNASLFSMLYFVALYPLVHHLFPFDITLVILTVLLTVVYVVILKILYKRQLQELFKFKKIDKVYGVLIGIGLAAIYWIIKFYLEK
jgi:cation transport ATPase